MINGTVRFKGNCQKNISSVCVHDYQKHCVNPLILSKENESHLKGIGTYLLLSIVKGWHFISFQLFFIFIFFKAAERGKKKNKGLCVNLSGTILLKKTPMYMSIKKAFQMLGKQLNLKLKINFLFFSFFFFSKHELSWLV